MVFDLPVGYLSIGNLRSLKSTSLREIELMPPGYLTVLDLLAGSFCGDTCVTPHCSAANTDRLRRHAGTIIELNGCSCFELKSSIFHNAIHHFYHPVSLQVFTQYSKTVQDTYPHVRNGSQSEHPSCTYKSCLLGLLVSSKACSQCRQLNDKSLFKQQCYVNGEWIKAKSGKTFEVTGLIPTRKPSTYSRLTIVLQILVVESS